MNGQAVADRTMERGGENAREGVVKFFSIS